MRFAIIAFAMYPLNIVSRDNLRDLLDLRPERIFSHGEIWRLLSYPLVFQDVFPLAMFIIALILFGGALERLWEPRRLVAAFGAITLSQGTIWLIAPFAGQPPALSGAESLTFFMLSSAFWLYPQRFITLWNNSGIHAQATIFALIMVSFGAIGYAAVTGDRALFLQGSFQSASGIIAGLAAAFIYQRYRTIRRTSMVFPAEMATIISNTPEIVQTREYYPTLDIRPGVQMRSAPDEVKRSFGLLGVGKRIRVMYKALLDFTNQRLHVNMPQANQVVEQLDAHEQFNDEDYGDENKLNSILDIIFERGYDSLLPEEKKFLDRYSRNLH